MKPKIQLILFSGLLVLVIIALLLRQIDIPNASARLAAYPESGPGFSSQHAELTEFERDMLGEALARKSIYAWRGLRYAVIMIDGTRNRQAVHDPRYCFRGAGWKIVTEDELKFAGGEARKLTLENESTTTEALFYYSDGEEVFDSPFEYWTRATKRRWLRKWGGPEPVLVIIQPVDPEVPLQPAIEGLLPLLPVP